MSVSLPGSDDDPPSFDDIDIHPYWFSNKFRTDLKDSFRTRYEKKFKAFVDAEKQQQHSTVFNHTFSTAVFNYTFGDLFHYVAFVEADLEKMELLHQQLCLLERKIHAGIRKVCSSTAYDLGKMYDDKKRERIADYELLKQRGADELGEKFAGTHQAPDTIPHRPPEAWLVKDKKRGETDEEWAARQIKMMLDYIHDNELTLENDVFKEDETKGGLMTEEQTVEQQMNNGFICAVKVVWELSSIMANRFIHTSTSIRKKERRWE